MKLGRFFTYPCRGVLHTPEMSCTKDLGIKPAKFFTYPCRAQKHTPRNVLRQGFAPKTGQVLGISLLGRVKSGAFLAGTCVEI